MTRILTVVLAAAALTGCQAFGATEATVPAPITAPPVPAAEAVRLLGTLEVRPEDTGAHYLRADWHKDWAYDPATKCNTREQVLIRDGDGEIVDNKCRSTCPRTAPDPACWHSLYDGVKAYTPAELQIDHIVALREAARSGTRGWTPDQRKTFANDPDNLLAVSSASNSGKGGDDVGRGRPSNQAAWCRVAATIVLIKARYRMHVDQAEHAALAAMLRTCPAASSTATALTRAVPRTAGPSGGARARS